MFAGQIGQSLALKFGKDLEFVDCDGDWRTACRSLQGSG